MKLDPNKSKAYGGGISGIGTFLAGTTVAEHLTTVITWLLGLIVANAPEEVAGAISYLLVGLGSYAVGYFVTFMFPPNEPSDHAARHEAQIARIEKKLNKGE